MAVEIERKFLLAHDGWKAAVVRTIHITDGLVSIESGCHTRVRIADGAATLALKGPRVALSRPEFEFAIPLADAMDILRVICGERVLAKSRHLVPYGGLTWEVDVYEGLLEGVSIAEVELEREDQPFALPGWAGREVTGDPSYAKVNMLATRLLAACG